MKPKYLYLPLLAWILTPNLVILFTQVFFSKVPLSKAFQVVIEQIEAIILSFSAIPYLILIVVIWSLCVIVKKERLSFMFWGAFLIIFGFTLWDDISVFYPIYSPWYQGKHVSSTAVLDLYVTPFLCIVLLPVGLGLGWLIHWIWKDYKSKV